VEVRALAPEAKKRRHRAGESKEKPGKVSWVHGTKLKFFEGRKPQWLSSTEAGKSGPFYTKMARLYTLKYGYELKDHEDLAEDIADPPDEEADRVVNEILEEGVAQARAAHFKKLREVCEIERIYKRRDSRLTSSESERGTAASTGPW
jgi:hypothetical protein